MTAPAEDFPALADGAYDVYAALRQALLDSNPDGPHAPARAMMALGATAAQIQHVAARLDHNRGDLAAYLTRAHEAGFSIMTQVLAEIEGGRA